MTFPASAIALLTGKSRQNVQQLLAAIPPTDYTVIGGNRAAAWHFGALPAALQSQLASVARAQGFGDASGSDFDAVRAMFAASAPVWQPPVPFSQAPAQARAIAAKRRNVFEPILRGLKLDTRSAAEREAAGVTDYAKVFGHAITPRGFRKLLAQIIDRDGGREDWMRLELYLPANITRPPVPMPAKVKLQCDVSRLAARLVFQGATKPTLTERQNALEYSFVLHDELISDAPHQRLAIKRDILTALFAYAPALAVSAAALKRNWNRKYDRWKKNGQTPGAVQDLRAMPSDQPWLAELEGDLKLIISEAWHHDGRISLAYRKLRRAGKLSQAFMDRYTLDVRRNKSYVAKTIRAEINRHLTGTLAFRRGPRAVRDAGPHIARSHDHYQPGDYFAADDVKWNSHWWYIGDDGRPAVTCGECLVWFDCRSLYPLGYVLTPGYYNGETIRRGMLHIHDKHGLPHKKFIYERGTWESRLLLGERRQGFLGWDEYEMNLRERGLAIDIANVTTPGAKLIETVFNLLQQDMRNLPGFVGFNERSYNQEAMQKLIGQVRRGTVDPRGKLLSQEQIARAFDSAFESYMGEPQNGKLLQGQSPAEMFSTHRPLRQLPDDARYLLASHRVRARIKSDGLTITIRGQRRSFYSKELGPYHGRDMFAFFNLEQPDLLTVSTLDQKTFFSVKRHVLPAFDATDEQLKEANRARGGFMQAPKLLFDQIKHPTRRAITRDDVIDDDGKALGAHIRRETEQHEAGQSAEKKAFARLARVADAAGVPLRPDTRNPGRVCQALEEEIELRQTLARNVQEQTNP